MTFEELRREVSLLLWWHYGTLRLKHVRSDEHTYLMALLEMIEDFQLTVRAYLCERTMRQEVEKHEAQACASTTSHNRKE